MKDDSLYKDIFTKLVSERLEAQNKIIIESMTQIFRQFTQDYIEVLSSNLPIDLDLQHKAEMIYSESLVTKVLGICEKITGYKLEDLKIKSRGKEFTTARHFYAYALRTYTYLTFKKIGEMLGDRNHATVLHMETVVENDIFTKTEPIYSWAKQIAKLEESGLKKIVKNEARGKN